MEKRVGDELALCAGRAAAADFNSAPPAIRRRVADALSLSHPLTLLKLRPKALHKKGSPYSITERRVPKLIPVLGSQP